MRYKRERGKKSLHYLLQPRVGGDTGDSPPPGHWPAFHFMEVSGKINGLSPGDIEGNPPLGNP